MTLTRSRRWLLGVVFATGACAAAPRPLERAANPRIPDSVPERRAAQRAATPELEAEDERWGISAAEERSRADGRAAKLAAPLPPRSDIPTVNAAPTTPRP
ncbi:MAG TPA: hypothetical protein VHJ20_10980 [Polyangia bacterium]|nr:hypothetical protein [Polyangia bacterium]